MLTLHLYVLCRFQIKVATFAFFDINRLVLYSFHGEGLLHGMHTVWYTFIFKVLATWYYWEVLSLVRTVWITLDQHFAPYYGLELCDESVHTFAVAYKSVTHITLNVCVCAVVSSRKMVVLWRLKQMEVWGAKAKAVGWMLLTPQPYQCSWCSIIK